MRGNAIRVFSLLIVLFVLVNNAFDQTRPRQVEPPPLMLLAIADSRMRKCYESTPHW